MGKSKHTYTTVQTFEIMYEINLIGLSYSFNVESNNYPHCYITAMNCTLLPKEALAENSVRFDYVCHEEQSLISLLALHGNIEQWLNGTGTQKDKKSLIFRG